MNIINNGNSNDCNGDNTGGDTSSLGRPGNPGNPGDKYLITGGAGFLGINLARYLLKKGHHVRTLDLAEFAYPEKNDVETFHGDIRDPDTITKAAAGMDILIHTAAALPLYTPADIYSTDVDGTANVLEAARRNNIKRTLHISTTAVYGIPDHHPLLEDDPLIGVGHYGKAKIMAEELCLEHREKGFCVPIIRPKSFIGPERLGVFALLFDWAKNGKNFPLLGNGKNLYQLLDVEDLCTAIYLAATAPEKTANETYNIGAKKYATMKEDFQSVLDHAGYGKRIITFPAAPLVLMLRLLEALHLSPLYKWVYETAFKDSFVSIEKAETQLCFRPKYSNQDALIRNFKWYLENLHTFADQSGISHRQPWKQGILKLAKLFF
jgi:nucleoside-diphosphate-sugar epimerase